MRKKTKLSILVISAFLTSSLFTAISLVSAQEVEEKYFFSVTIISTPGTRTDIATICANEFKKIGIDAKILTFETSTWFERFDKTPLTYDEGGFDICIISAGTSGAQGYHFMWHPIDRAFDFGWQSAEIGHYIDLAEKEWEWEERAYWYHKADEQMVKEMPHLPIYEKVVPIIAKKSINGFDTTYTARACDAFYYHIDGTTPEEDTTFVYATLQPIINWNPIFQTHASFVSIGGIYDSWYLWPMNQRDKPPKPLLCKGFEVTPDHLNYTIHFRDDVTFSDGIKFNVSDIKLVYDLILDPATMSPSQGIYEEYIDSVSIVDEFTLRVILKKPHPDFPFDALNPQPLPWHLLKDVDHADFMTHWSNTGEGTIPISVGPYKVVEWVKDEYVVLEARDDYWQGKPDIDRVIAKNIPDKSTALLALQAGEIDVLDEWYGFGPEVEELKDDPNLQVWLQALANVEMLVINHNYGPLANVFVRHAMAYAIPREHIVQDYLLGNGYESSQLVTRLYPLLWNPDLKPIPYDIEKAKEYMEKAGYDYKLLELPPEPPSLIIPAAIGVVVGFVIGAVVIWFLKKQSSA